LRLLELEPQWLRVTSPTSWADVASIYEADGIMFACPSCHVTKGNTNVGVHRIICWRPRVSPSLRPGPGRWKFLGSGYDDLSLYAESSSIAIPSGCMAHFFIREGEIVNC
jgi:hypothetical protein